MHADDLVHVAIELKLTCIIRKTGKERYDVYQLNLKISKRILKSSIRYKLNSGAITTIEVGHLTKSTKQTSVNEQRHD